MHRSLLPLGLLVVLVGCSGEPATPMGAEAEINDLALAEFGELYRIYSIDKKAPPKSQQDIAPYEIGFSQAYAALANNEIVVDGWGATLPDLSEAAGVVKSDQVLAHQSKVPTEGGLVILLDRRIVQMTPDEYKAAPKAGTPAPAAPAP